MTIFKDIKLTNLNQTVLTVYGLNHKCQCSTGVWRQVCVYFVCASAKKALLSFRLMTQASLWFLQSHVHFWNHKIKVSVVTWYRQWALTCTVEIKKQLPLWPPHPINCKHTNLSRLTQCNKKLPVWICVVHPHLLLRSLPCLFLHHTFVIEAWKPRLQWICNKTSGSRFPLTRNLSPCSLRF